MELKNELVLPCGVVLGNRLAKSAMSDSLGDGEGNATLTQMRLYEKWALGGVALSFIGEVQVDARFPEKPGNITLNKQSDLQALRQLAKRASINGAHIWPQLGNAGALAHLPISQPRGPSALNIDGLQCAAMSPDDIAALPGQYAQAAALAKDIGFGGVHLHCGHGFLFSQFLSPLFNKRTDDYGGDIVCRCRIILEVIDAVRRAVGKSFAVGIRINATDMLEGGLTEDDALEVVRLLNQTSVDLIDISGGTYFPGAKASSDKAGGGPYFINFARRAKTITNIPLMATGGFKKREQAIDAVATKLVDVVGIARAMVLNPRLAEEWLNYDGKNPTFPKFQHSPPGGITAWYTMRLTAIGEDNEENYSPDVPTALRVYEERDAARCIKWQKKFRHLWQT